MNRWKGRVAIQPALGVFLGNTGDNAPHRHWAHQLSIGIGGPVRLATHREEFSGEAWFIPAGTIHRLSRGEVLSFYLDPASTTARALRRFLDLSVHESPGRPVSGLVDALRAKLDSGPEELLREFSERMGIDSVPPDDSRLAAAAAVLRAGLEGESRITRRELAALAGLSESRFSHWFRERTGIPLRSYRKWLALTIAIEAVRDGASLTDAAHRAGFSDQSHFTRFFVEMFGLAPSHAFSEVVFP